MIILHHEGNCPSMQVGSTFLNKKFDFVVDMVWTSVFCCWGTRSLHLSVLCQFFWQVCALEFYASAVTYLSVELAFVFLCSSARGWFLVLPDQRSGQVCPLCLNHHLLNRSLFWEMSAHLNFVWFGFIYANGDHWLQNSPTEWPEICRKRLLHCQYFVCHS